jgi:TonB family protein
MRVDLQTGRCRLIRILVQIIVLMSCAYSAAVNAADVELLVPEIGVRFADFPPDVSRPRVSERPEGYDAVMTLGLVSLVLYREDAPAQHAVADPAYQEALRAEFMKKVSRVDVAAPTIVGGQQGWLMSGIQLAGRVNVWHVVVYVVADNHLFRLSLHALGASQRPPELERMASLFQQIGFVPVQRAQAAAPALPGAEGRLPRFVSNGETVYPADAVRKRQQGRVIVSFRIDERGRVQDLRQTFSSHRGLGKAIPEYLHNGRFRVPANWAESGQPERKFTVEFQLFLVQPGTECPADRPPRVPGSEVWNICRPRAR